MIGKSTLKQYGYDSIYDYYKMTLESLINGNYKQARNQARKMSVEQRIEFLNYLPEITPDNNDETLWFRNYLIALAKR